VHELAHELLLELTADAEDKYLEAIDAWEAAAKSLKKEERELSRLELAVINARNDKKSRFRRQK